MNRTKRILRVLAIIAGLAAWAMFAFARFGDRIAEQLAEGDDIHLRGCPCLICRAREHTKGNNKR